MSEEVPHGLHVIACVLISRRDKMVWSLITLYPAETVDIAVSNLASFELNTVLFRLDILCFVRLSALGKCISCSTVNPSKRISQASWMSWTSSSTSGWGTWSSAISCSSSTFTITKCNCLLNLWKYVKIRWLKKKSERKSRQPHQHLSLHRSFLWYRSIMMGSIPSLPWTELLEKHRKHTWHLVFWTLWVSASACLRLWRLGRGDSTSSAHIERNLTPAWSCSVVVGLSPLD